MDKDKLFKKAKMFILIIGVIYLTLTVLACISAVNDIANSSTTTISFEIVMSLVWFQICVVAFLAFTYYLYNKKSYKGIIFEIIIATALILNVVVNMMISNIANSLVLLNFVIPVALLIHSFLCAHGMYLQNKEMKIKKMFKV